MRDVLWERKKLGIIIATFPVSKEKKKGKRKCRESVNFLRIFAIFVMPDTVNIWLESVNFKQIRMHHGCLPSKEFNDSVEHDPY